MVGLTKLTVLFSLVLFFFIVFPRVSQPANAAICGDACSQDADCQRATGGGFQPVCYQGKCQNPLCPGYTTYGTICGCDAAPTGIACGELCGGQDNGLVYPHNCLNGTCGNNKNGGDSGNRCLPNTATGYIMKGGICKNDPNPAVYCIEKSDGTLLGNLADIKAACAVANPPINDACDSPCNSTSALCPSGLACTDIGGGTMQCRDSNFPSSATCSPDVCLSINKNVDNPQIGQPVIFTCGTVPNATSYQFQYSTGSTMTSLPASATGSNISQALTVAAGAYQVQCRPCTVYGCTPWDGATPTPTPLPNATSTPTPTPTCNGSLLGTYTDTFNLANAGVIIHTMTITTQNPDGSFSGTGFYNANPEYTWAITGTVSATRALSYNLVYTGLRTDYYVNGTGTVNADGSWTATASAPASPTGTLSAARTACQ